MKVEILNESQIDGIHEKSLQILEKVGVNIPHEDILNLFKNFGANVDFKKKIVKIPENLVMDLLSKAGSSFSIYGRDLTKKAEFGVGKHNYNTTAGQAFWIESIGSERRYASINDVVFRDQDLGDFTILNEWDNENAKVITILKAEKNKSMSSGFHILLSNLLFFII